MLKVTVKYRTLFVRDIADISPIYRRYLGTAVEVFSGTNHRHVGFIGGHLKLLVKGKATLAKSTFSRRHSDFPVS